MGKVSDFILLEDSILERYGLYTDIDTNKTDWLKSQDDSGELYNNLRAKIIDNRDIKDSQNLVNALETEIFKYIENELNKDDYEVFLGIVKYFEKGDALKSKISKLTRGMNVHSIENLSISYKIPLSTFIYTKFNIKMPHKEMYIKIKHSLDVILLEYKKAIDKLRDAKKYTENKTKFLSKEMENYNNGINLEKYDKFKRTRRSSSKYKGMNWSKLNTDEKIEVINEYISTKWSDTRYQSIVSEFVINEYNAKNIEYRNIKWVKEYGYICNITGFLVDPETFECSLSRVQKQIKHDTIFNTNPGIINEELLYYIIVHEYSIEYCITKLQATFNIQKVPFSVIKKLTLLYNDMKKVISDNLYETE